MQIQLNVTDVFNAAILLEKRAAEFYETNAGLFTADREILLNDLAEMELGHARQFEGFLEKLPDQLERAADPKNPEAISYLQAFTSGRIITRETQIDKQDSFEQILEKAMLMEKQSVFFYTGIKNIVTTQIDAKEIDILINEELAHFRMLHKALLKATAPTIGK